MTTKEKLLQAIEQSPEALLQELLGFLNIYQKYPLHSAPETNLANSPRNHVRRSRRSPQPTPH